MEQAFRLFDADSDGFIDKREISELIQYEQKSWSRSTEFEEILSEIDLNNDGKIDFQEFVGHITQAVDRAKTRTASSIPGLSE